MANAIGSNTAILFNSKCVEESPDCLLALATAEGIPVLGPAVAPCTKVPSS